MASWDGSALTLTWPLPPAFPTPTEGSIRFCSSSSAGSSPHFLPCKCCQFSGLQPHPFALFTLHLPGASFTLTVCIPHLYQRLSCRPLRCWKPPAASPRAPTPSAPTWSQPTHHPQLPLVLPRPLPPPPLSSSAHPSQKLQSPHSSLPSSHPAHAS